MRVSKVCSRWRLNCSGDKEEVNGRAHILNHTLLLLLLDTQSQRRVPNHESRFFDWYRPNVPYQNELAGLYLTCHIRRVRCWFDFMISDGTGSLIPLRTGILGLSSV